MTRVWTSVFLSAGFYKYFEVSQQSCWSECAGANKWEMSTKQERERIEMGNMVTWKVIVEEKWEENKSVDIHFPNISLF